MPSNTTREVSVNSNKLWLEDLLEKASLSGSIWDGGCKGTHEVSTDCGICSKVIPQFRDAFVSVPRAHRAAFTQGLRKANSDILKDRNICPDQSPLSKDPANLTYVSATDGTYQCSFGRAKPGRGQFGPILTSDGRTVDTGVFLLEPSTDPSISVNLNSLWGADLVAKAKLGGTIWDTGCSGVHDESPDCGRCSKVIPQLQEAFYTVPETDRIAFTHGLANAYTGTFLKSQSNRVPGSLTCTKNSDGTWEAYFGRPKPVPGHDNFGLVLDPDNTNKTLKGVFLLQAFGEDSVVASVEGGRHA